MQKRMYKTPIRDTGDLKQRLIDTLALGKRITKQACAAEMAVRYAALSACRKVHVCHCNSLGGAT